MMLINLRKVFCRALAPFAALLLAGALRAYAEPAEKLRGRALQPGDTIAVTAPAYWTYGEIGDTVQAIRDAGYEVRICPTVDKRFGYFAGTAEERAAELNALFADDSVDAILCLRGGYGTVEMLKSLDYGLIAAHPKLFIGFSDVCAIHAALYEHCGLVTIHGPMLTTLRPPTMEVTAPERRNVQLDYDEAGRAFLPDGCALTLTVPYGAEQSVRVQSADGEAVTELLLPPGSRLSVSVPVGRKEASQIRAWEAQFAALDAYTWEQFLNGLASCEAPGEIPLPEGSRLSAVNPGRAEGNLIGGNLTTLASMAGTSYEPDGTGCLLFLEEIGESAYRIDRMLRQLYECGLLKRVSGIVYGGFTDCPDGEFTVSEILARYAMLSGKPAIQGFPAGHDRENAFLPFGVHAVLSAEPNAASLYIDEPYAVSPESAAEPEAPVEEAAAPAE